MQLDMSSSGGGFGVLPLREAAPTTLAFGKARMKKHLVPVSTEEEGMEVRDGGGQYWNGNLLLS